MKDIIKITNHIVKIARLIKENTYKVLISIDAFIKIMYYLLLLFLRKLGRAFLRFIKRLIQIWYIGVSLILFKYIFEFFKINISLGTISITVFIIDFLRVEYDRRKNVNLRYFLHLQMWMYANEMLNMFDELLGVHLTEFSKENLANRTPCYEIYNIISEPNFWDMPINLEYTYYDYDKSITRNSYFLKSFDDYALKINELIFSDMPKDRDVFRFLNSLKYYLTHSLLTNQKNCNLVNQDDMSWFIRNWILEIIESKKYREKWNRDYDLEHKIKQISYTNFNKQREAYKKIIVFLNKFDGEL
jgi:hypothetical protein